MATPRRSDDDAALDDRAPDDLRQAFLSGIEQLYHFDAEPTVAFRDRRVTMRALCAMLRNCTDTLPATECGYLGVPEGTTYGQAARKIKRERLAG
jgi:hypothetical protein